MGVYRLFAAMVAGVSVVQAAIPSMSGYRLTWGEDFIGGSNSLPNTGNWIIDTGTSYPGGPANWGTGEIQTYTSSSSNLRLDGNGNLLITALKDGGGRWTSARIESQRSDFMAQPGRKMLIQAKINLPNVSGQQAAGYWPAFWTLGARYRGNYQNWPGIGEFDIMENANGFNSIYGTLHCGTNPGGACHETSGRSAHTTSSPLGTPFAGNWHTYALEVDRSGSQEALRWFVDGRLFWQIVQSDLNDDNAWAQSVHNPHFVLLNLAMGGAFPNALFGGSTPLPQTVSGGTMQVDYVAVYNS